MTISAWSAGGKRIPSPDGTLWAAVEEADEFQMSGPKVGRLRLSNGLQEECCGVSLVWSADSRFLAVPKLFPQPPRPHFRILLVDIATGERRFASGKFFAPIELATFEAGTITALEGADDPTIRREIDVSRVQWSANLSGRTSQSAKVGCRQLVKLESPSDRIKEPPR